MIFALTTHQLHFACEYKLDSKHHESSWAGNGNLWVFQVAGDEVWQAQHSEKTPSTVSPQFGHCQSS